MVTVMPGRTRGIDCDRITPGVFIRIPVED
jgi:hypothetical protein